MAPSEETRRTFLPSARLEYPGRWRCTDIKQRRNLRIRIDFDKAAAELVAVIDPDEMSVVLGTFMAECEQFFKQHGDLYTIWGGQRIELQRMLASGQFLLVRWACNRPVDAFEFATAGLVPGPDFGRCIRRCAGHD
jgi:hypothetical protein